MSDEKSSPSQKWLLTLLLLLYFEQTFAQERPGDPCGLKNGQSGICQLLKQCPSAIAGISQNRFPKLCGFQGTDSIVCCENIETTTQKQPLGPVIDSSMVEAEKHNRTSFESKPLAISSSVQNFEKTTQVPIVNIPLVTITPVQQFDTTTQKQILDSKINSSNSETIDQNLNLFNISDILAELEEEISEKKEKEAQRIESIFLELMADLRRTNVQDIQGQFTDSVNSSIPGTVAAYQCKEYGKLVFLEYIEYGSIGQGGGGVGGEDAAFGEFPHAVAIGYGKQVDNNAWKCSGSLIAEKWVLTAAHCNFDRSLGLATFIKAGIVNQSDAGETIPIIQRIRHPEYSENSFYNDISLLKLLIPVTFSLTLYPACVRYIPIEDPSAIAIGWGLKDWRDTETSRILQKVELQVYNKTICDNVFENDSRLKNKFNEESQLCIGYLQGGRDTCSGDSGGSVSQPNILFPRMVDIVGITATGTRFCGSPNSPGLYTRVFHYLDWIERNVWPKFFR